MSIFISVFIKNFTNKWSLMKQCNILIITLNKKQAVAEIYIYKIKLFLENFFTSYGPLCNLEVITLTVLHFYSCVI